MSSKTRTKAATRASSKGNNSQKISLDDLDEDQIKALLAQFAKNKKAETLAKKKTKAAAEEAAVQQSEAEWQRGQSSSQGADTEKTDDSDGNDDDDDAASARKRRHASGSDSESSTEQAPAKKAKHSAIEASLGAVHVADPKPLKKRDGAKKKQTPATGNIEPDALQPQADTPASGPFTPYRRKVNPNAANKPRGEDFTPTTKRMVDEGKTQFSVYISTENAFPKDDEAFGKADNIFMSSASAADSTTQTGRRGARFQADETYRKDVRNAIKNSMSAFRGRVVEAAEPLVESAYELKKKKETKEARAKRVKDLLEGGQFAFEDTDKREGFLGNDIIPELFSKTFLYRASNKKQGLGYGQHAAAFKEVPNHLLAFLLTAIECALRHWTLGIYKEEKFDGNVYDEVYDAHLDSIEYMQSQAPDYLQELRGELWETLCELAGVQPTIIVHDADDEDTVGYIAKDDVTKLIRRRKKTGE